MYDLNFDLNNGCNLRCIMCGHADGLTPVTKQHVMPLNNFLRYVLPAVKESRQWQMGCMHEPSVVPYWDDAVNGLSKFGCKNGRINTNAMALGENKMMRLFDAGIISELKISCDGTDAETFEKIRVGSKFKVFIDRLHSARKIIDEHGYKVKIELVFTAQLLNRHQWVGFESWASSHGADSVVVHKLGGRQATKETDDIYSECSGSKNESTYAPPDCKRDIPLFILEHNGNVINASNGSSVGNVLVDSMPTIASRT